jgi:hypothetical protein
MIRSPWFQTWATQQLANYFTKEMNVQVEVGGVDIKFFKTLSLTEVLILDHHKDTLFFIPVLDAGFGGFDSENNKIRFSDVAIEGLIFRLKIYEQEDESNLRLIMNHLENDAPPSEKPSTLFFDEVSLKDIYFSFVNENYQDTIDGVNFKDIEIFRSDILAKDFKIVADTIQAKLLHVDLIEKSGFELYDLQTDFLVTRDFIDIKKTRVTTPHSKVQLDLLMTHDTWLDYNDFNNLVPMDGQIFNSTVSFADIVFFAPELKGMTEVVTINEGEASGVVESLRCNKLDLTLFESTILKGSIDFKGLPYIDKTFANFRINELQTTYADLLRIPVPPFENQNKLTLPSNFNTLGKMNFRGSFTGDAERLCCLRTIR